jgi:hypothetical protein
VHALHLDTQKRAQLCAVIGEFLILLEGLEKRRVDPLHPALAVIEEGRMLPQRSVRSYHFGACSAGREQGRKHGHNNAPSSLSLPANDLPVNNS